MPDIITVTAKEYSVGTDGAERVYNVTGTADDAAALSAAAQAAPAAVSATVGDKTYQFNFKSVSVEEVFVDEDLPEECLWEATVRYASPDDEEREAGESSWAFDTGGGTQHIVKSRSATVYKPTGDPVTLAGGANIGDKGDSVEGVDIYVPACNVTRTFYVDDEKVTDAYRDRVAALTGRVNSEEFLGRAPGEVLFLGSSGSQRGRGDWEIAFRVAIGENVEDAQIPTGELDGEDPVMITYSKTAWQYLDGKYETSVADNEMVQILKRVTIHTVYPSDDLNKLDPDWESEVPQA